MTRIFISYRRDDSAAITGRIHDHLVRKFGSKNVFMDVDTLVPGQDFPRSLGKALKSCGCPAGHYRSLVAEAHQFPGLPAAGRSE